MGAGHALARSLFTFVQITAVAAAPDNLFLTVSTVALLVGASADRFGFVITYQLCATVGLGAIPFTFLIRTK